MIERCKISYLNFLKVVVYYSLMFFMEVAMANAFIITFELMDEELIDELYKEVNFTAFYGNQISPKMNPVGKLTLPLHTLIHKIANDVSVGDVCMNFIDILETHLEKKYELKRVCVVGNDGKCAAAEYKKTVCNVFVSPENLFCNF